jgi:uncharacterized repeat protein (TIGR01451 family)
MSKPRVALTAVLSSILLATTAATVVAADPSEVPTFVRTWGSVGTADGQFIDPRGIATDSSGNVYVVEYGNQRVQKFTSSGSFVTKWGSYGRGEGQFIHPWGIAADAAGNIYVSDIGNKRIEKFSSSGTFLAQWGNEGTDDGQFMTPGGVATDSAGDVYVADSGNDRIQKFTSSGTFLTTWGSSGLSDGEFETPSDVTVDRAGNVYVADLLHHQIQKFSSTGTFIARVGGGLLSDPIAVASDSADNLYVSNRNADQIVKFSSTGTFLATWGTSGADDGQFRDPVGIAVDDSDNVFVVDPGNGVEPGNGRIEEFSYLEEVPPVADVSPSSLDFGNVTVGVPSASQQVTVTADADGGAVHIGQLATTGTNATEFGIGSDQCSNTTLTAGTSCTALVTLVPLGRGLRTATLNVPDDAADSPQTVSLTGSGVAPVASLSPASLGFGTVEIGTTSPSQVLTITNTGDEGQSLTFTSLVVGGMNAADFAITSDGCVTAGAVLGKDASCRIGITFTPGAAGARSATLTLRDNAGDSPQIVTLSGTGGTPSADLAIGISAAAGGAKAKGRLTYTITIYNAGPSTALNLLLNDTLSSQTTFVSAAPSHGTCVSPLPGASGVVACNLGSLTSGGSAPMQIVVTVIAKKGSVTNTVTVSSSTADPNLANNTASITTHVK